MALGSVLKQSHPVSEIVIVDDCSDPPLKVRHHKAIKLIRNDKNKGPAFSRNRGVANSSGEFIAFLDADDQWFLDKINVQIKHLEKVSKQLAGRMKPCVVLCGAEVVRSGVRTCKIPREFQDMKYFMSGNWFFPGSTLLIRRTLFIKMGGFDPNLCRLEDYEFFIRLRESGAIFTVVKRALCRINEPHASYPK